MTFNYNFDPGNKTNDKREHNMELKLKYHHLYTTSLFTTSWRKSGHGDCFAVILLFMEIQLQRVICGTLLYEVNFFASYNLCSYPVSSDLIYKYKSSSSNTYFVFWLIFLCDILKLTHLTTGPIIHIYLHIDTHTHTQLPNCKTLSFRSLICSGG